VKLCGTREKVEELFTVVEPFKYGFVNYMRYLKRRTVDDLIRFLYQYRERPSSYNSVGDLNEAGFDMSIYDKPVYAGIKSRKDVKALEALLSERWKWFAAQYTTAAEWWGKSNDCTRYYLLCRACDLVAYGESYKSLPPSTFSTYEEVVHALVSLSEDTQARLDEEGGGGKGTEAD
jgi:hypothetical protein